MPAAADNAPPDPAAQARRRERLLRYTSAAIVLASGGKRKRHSAVRIAVLLTLFTCGGKTRGELLTAISIPDRALRRMLYRMQEERLITSSKEADRRERYRYRYHLTPIGLRLLNIYYSDMRHTSEALAHL